jgi:transposase
MDVLIDRCAGIDVDKKTVKVAVRSPGHSGRGRHEEVRTFRTCHDDLEAMAAWLVSLGVTHVAMESTGAYWKPVFYALEDRIGEVLLVNATHIKMVPGRKTDVSDASWIARCLECGLLRASFIPAPVFRELRDLTRYRKALVSERAREHQRIEKTLEDAGIKIGAVAAKTLGVSARAMVEALIGGERDATVLAELAQRRLRPKIPELQRALVGRFSPHHGRLLTIALRHLDELEADIAELDGHVDEVMAPFAGQRDALMEIPGVGKRTAETIIAECGVDMSRFASASHLASWAGVCPGNNESGGKRRSGRARKGNKHLRAALTEAAWAATNAKDSYLRAQFYRLRARRGPERAQLAVSHSILVIAYSILATGQRYTDLGADYFSRRQDPDEQRRRLVARLEKLGYQVAVTKAA